MRLVISLIVLVAACEDFYSGRISNCLIVIGTVIGIAGNIPPVGENIFRIALITLIMFCLYMFGVFGAGDSKLFSVIGLYVNFKEWSYIFFATLIIGLIIGIVKRALGAGNKVRLGVAIFISDILVRIMECIS